MGSPWPEPSVKEGQREHSQPQSLLKPILHLFPLRIQVPSRKRAANDILELRERSREQQEVGLHPCAVSVVLLLVEFQAT